MNFTFNLWQPIPIPNEWGNAGVATFVWNASFKSASLLLVSFYTGAHIMSQISRNIQKHQRTPSKQRCCLVNFRICYVILRVHHKRACWHLQRPGSQSDKTSYCKISRSLEAARIVFRIIRALWNLTNTSIPRLRGFTRSHDETSYRILKSEHHTWANIISFGLTNTYAWDDYVPFTFSWFHLLNDYTLLYRIY